MAAISPYVALDRQTPAQAFPAVVTQVRAHIYIDRNPNARRISLYQCALTGPTFSKLFHMDAVPSETLWYFAYGSNMSSAKFTGSRGIVPLKTMLVRIPQWILTMEIPGVPYAEPAFSAIRRRGESDPEIGLPDVIGVAYLITSVQYQQVVASEGGGIAYKDVFLGGIAIKEEKRKVQLRTLAAAMTRSPPPRPSSRYMTLLRDGAHEQGLPLSYQGHLASLPTLQPFPSLRTRLGARIFLAIWGPVFVALERLTKASLQGDGTSPNWLIVFVRSTMFIMWITHDHIFAPLFGHGDGLAAGEVSAT